MSTRAAWWTLGLLWGFAVWGLLLLVRAQAEPVGELTLAWAYGTDTIDRFILERKQGLTGTWAALPLVIAPAARSAQDATVTVGQLYCWRVRAALTTQQSEPSNEACAAVLSAPTLLRVQ